MIEEVEEIDWNNLSLLDIAENIELTIQKFEESRSKKEKKALDEQFILYAGKYHERVGQNNIYKKSLFT